MNILSIFAYPEATGSDQYVISISSAPTSPHGNEFSHLNMAIWLSAEQLDALQDEIIAAKEKVRKHESV